MGMYGKDNQVSKKEFERLLDTHTFHRATWEGKYADRLTPYCGFQITPIGPSQWEIVVWEGRGNYDGGDKTLPLATKEDCLKLFDEWCWIGNR